MAYTSAFLRKLKLPLSVLGFRRNSETELNTPIVGLKDLSLWTLIQDTIALNKNEEYFTATAAQTAFVISKSLAAKSGNNVPLEVYRNGSKLKWVASAPAAGQYTYSGSTITTSSSTVSDVIIVVY